MATFDLARTIALLRGAALDPEPTWRTCKAAGHDWSTMTTLLAGPMVVAAAILAPVVGWVFGTNLASGVAGFVTQIAIVMVGGGLTLAVAATVFGLLAGSFGGVSSFDDGFAAVTLAAVPAYAGQVLIMLPWIGWLLALGLTVYAFILLYRCLPVFLDIPQAQRGNHFLVSFLLLFLVATLIDVPLAGLLLAGQPAPLY